MEKKDKNDKIPVKNGPLDRKEKRRMIRIFLGMLIVPTLCWLMICVIGVFSPSFKEKVNFDLNEKRNMASFPTSLSGDICAEIEDCYNDHIPFRSVLITADTKLKTLAEAPYNNGIRDALVSAFHHAETSEDQETTGETTMNYADIFGTDETEGKSAEDAEETEEVAAEEEEADSSEVVSETETETDYAAASNVVPTEAVDDSYFAPVISNTVLLGRANWLFLGEEIDYYLGNNLATDEELITYADTLSRLKALCDQKGKKLAVLMVPCKAQVYPEYMPTYELSNTYKRVQRIVDYVTENTDVEISYPLDELKSMKDYYLVYKKYDSHWNNAGSFVGYQMILKLLGMPTTDPGTLTSDMTAGGTGGGDLISPGGLDPANYQNDYDYYIHYKEYVAQTGTEGEVFQEKIYYRMYSDAECADQVSIIGDSFRNHMVLYAYKDFQDSTLIHCYLLGDSTVDQILNESDDYVLIFTERNGSKMLDAANYLIDLLSR